MSAADLLNITFATNNKLGVLAVQEKELAENNSFETIVDNLHYYDNFQRHILKECQYFMLLRNSAEKTLGFLFC